MLSKGERGIFVEYDLMLWYIRFFSVSHLILKSRTRPESCLSSELADL